jgi:hypothetical protein
MALITIGPKNARTDPETGLRFYRWQGEEYPSVTSIRNLAGMPHKLAAWRTNQVIEKAIAEFPTFARMVNEGSDEKAIATWLRAGGNKKRDLAAELGTKVHDAAAAGVPVDKVGTDVAPFLVQYKRWLADSDIEIMLSERQVWNVSEGYAGTFDLLGRFKRTNKVFMIDLKTGAGTYPEHALQLEAYARCEFVGEDDVIDQAATDLLQKIEGRAILHLRPEGWTFKVIKPSEYGKLWMAFSDLMGFAMWSYQNPTLDSLISRTITAPVVTP